MEEVSRTTSDLKALGKRKQKRKSKSKSKSDSKSRLVQEEGSHNDCRKAKRLKRKRLARGQTKGSSGCRLKGHPLTAPKSPSKSGHPQAHQWAELALAHYKKQDEDAEFANVEVMDDCYDFVRGYENVLVGFYGHLFFNAMPKDVHVDCTEVISSKHFFAELYHNSDGFQVTFCHILNPNDPGFTLGCGICPKLDGFFFWPKLDGFAHPSAGFMAGHFPYQEPLMIDWSNIIRM